MGNNIKNTLSFAKQQEIWDAAAEIISDSIYTTECFQIYSKFWDTKQGYMETLMELWQQIDSIYDDNWHCKVDAIKHSRVVKIQCMIFTKVKQESWWNVDSSKPLPTTREVFAEGWRKENQKAVTMDPTYPTLQHIIKVRFCHKKTLNHMETSMESHNVKNHAIPLTFNGKFMENTLID